MELKPEYKQTAVGVIPKEWDVSTVGHEFEVKLGKMLDAAKNIGVPKPYLGNRAVQWDRIDISELPTVPMSRSDIERFRLKKGDLLVCEGGEVGRAAIWNAPIEECYYQKALHRLRPLRGFYQRLMVALLHQWSDRGLLANYVTQTSIAHLPRAKFMEVPMPVPSPSEQRTIADALSDVDALLGALDRLIAKRRDLKQATIQQLLTGQIRLPGFRGEWEVKRLGDVVDTDPENIGSETHPDFAFNYIALEDVERGFLRSHTEEVFARAPSRARRKLRPNDILVSTVRPNLQSHLLFCSQSGNWVCSTGFCVVRCRQGVTNPAYVFSHFFATSVNRQIEALLTGSNYPAINSGDVRALQIPMPGYEEQTAIATVLSDMNAELTALERRRDKTRALKQGMMQELLTGKTRLISPKVSHA
jgi:type I restriction enzyme, S subunit